MEHFTSLYTKFPLFTVLKSTTINAAAAVTKCFDLIHPNPGHKPTS